MRAARLLVDRPDFSVHAVTCRDDHSRWSPPEPVQGYGVVLVRSGGFRRRGRGGEVLADRTVGYATSPGDEEHFAHPYGGDDCTSIRLGPDLWRGPAGPIYVDAPATRTPPAWCRWPAWWVSRRTGSAALSTPSSARR